MENYGDHLFPMVLKRYFDIQKINYKIDLFSIYEQPEAFDIDVQVYSVFDLEKRQLQKPYDLLIVGGGDIVHYSAFQHNHNGKKKIYPIYALWTVPSLVAKKYNIKLVWNAPGIPFDFREPYIEFTKEVLDAVDYLSVRNISSKEALFAKGLYQKECFVYPDTAFALRGCFKEDNFLNIRMQIGLQDEKYVVFHFNALLPEDQKKEIYEAINKMKEKGFLVVLLPIAYTNGDIEYLKNVAEKFDSSVICIDKKLKIEQMVAVFAGCKLYVGLSYHGAITSYLYRKKIIAIDYPNQRKTKDLFDNLGILQYYMTNCRGLGLHCLRALDEEYDYDMLETQVEDVSKHFNHILETLYADAPQKKYLSAKMASNCLTELSLFMQNSVEPLRLNLYFSNEELKRREAFLQEIMQQLHEKEAMLQETNQLIEEMKNSVGWKAAGFTRWLGKKLKTTKRKV